MIMGKGLFLKSYPELGNYSQQDRDHLLSLARYKTFRKKGNNAKLVMLVVPIVLISIIVKVYLDLALREYVGNVFAGIVSFSVVFLFAYGVLRKVYTSFVKSALTELLYERKAT